MRLSRFQPDSFPLKVLHFDHQSTIDVHEHVFHELVLVVAGEGRHVTPAEEYTLSAGDIFLIKPGNPHGYEVEHDFSLFNILYEPERLNLPLFDLADEPGYRAFFELEPELRRQFCFRKHFRLGKSQLDELTLLVERMKFETESEEAGHRFRAVRFSCGCSNASRAYSAARRCSARTTNSSGSAKSSAIWNST